MHNKSMLHKPLRGLDGFPLVPRYKPPQMLGVIRNYEDYTFITLSFTTCSFR